MNSEYNAINPDIPSELLNEYGFVFGRKSGRTVAKLEDYNKTEGHILVVGGVGSGKSSCIAIPTLLKWRERVFAIDIKGELHKTVLEKRGETKAQEQIKIFDPLKENKLEYDPLKEKALGYDPFHLLKKIPQNKAQEAMTIAHTLIPMPHDVREPFWINNARNLLTGAILHYSNEKSFVETMIKLVDTPPEELIDEMSGSQIPHVKKFINSFIGMEDKTLVSVYATLHTHIILYATDEDIIRSLSKSEYITPEDLERGYDIYIVLPEYLLEQWRNLLTLLTSQFLSHFERRDENKDLTPVLFLLDEFPRLGKFEKITQALSTLRSKKITICLILQSLAQLDEIYGKDKRRVICDTCAYKAILSASDPETQKVFSDLVGMYIYKKISVSTPSGMLGKSIFSKDISEQDEKELIIRPERFATLQDIILLTPFDFFRVNKQAWYKNPEDEPKPSFGDKLKEFWGFFS